MKYILLFFIFFINNQYSQIITVKDGLENNSNNELNDKFEVMENLKDSTVIEWINNCNLEFKEKIKIIDIDSKNYNKIDNVYKSRKFVFRLIKYDTNGNLYYKKINTLTKSELIFKKNKLGEKKLTEIDLLPKKYSINYIMPNNKGTILALGLTEKGKELTQILLYDLLTDKLLPTKIENNFLTNLGGVKWLQNDSGFYYTRLKSNDISNKDYLKNSESVLYLLGESNEKYDVVFSKKSVNESENEEDFFMINKIHETTIFSEIGGVSKYRDFYYSVKRKNQVKNFKWKQLFSKDDYIKSFYLVNKDIYYLSNLNKTNVISKTNLKSKQFQNQLIIISPPKDEVIINLVCTKNFKYFTTLKNGIQASMYKFDDNGYKKIDLPFQAGTISEIYPKHNESDELIVELTGWTQPFTRFLYLPKVNQFVKENLVEQYQLEGLDDLVIEELEIDTHDGLKLPVSIIYRKDLIKNGKNRTIINAYGAYGTINEASFNFVDLLWTLEGGVHVTAHVRGGGVKGEAWHKGGFKATKPNSWKDVISATEYLIKEGYTSPNYIGLSGTSAGGITIANATIERPDLYKAVNINSAPLNIIKSETGPNGANNAKEFGSVHNETEFPHLLNMDAFIKLKPGIKYPAMLINAGLNDARVPAWHSAKFVAKSKEYDNEVYFDCDIEGGHSGSTINKALESIANRMSFFYWQLGHPDYQLKAD
jgi:prolyl oligopeptidase